MAKPQIHIPLDQIREFCGRWMVRELALFGSVVRADFRPDSDVDVLVRFADDAPWSLMELVVMRDELRRIFGRDVDLVELEGLRNPFRREAILREREIVYAA